MSLNIDITQDEYKIVHTILQNHLSCGSIVWVFGSRAKYTARFNSDLDLAIECSDSVPKKILFDLKEEFSQSPLPFTVDIVDINTISKDFKAIIMSHAKRFSSF